MGINRHSSISVVGGYTSLTRTLSDEELRILRTLRRISKPKRKLGYMKKLYVLKK